MDGIWNELHYLHGQLNCLMPFQGNIANCGNWADRGGAAGSVLLIFFSIALMDRARGFYAGPWLKLVSYLLGWCESKDRKDYMLMGDPTLG